MLALVSALVTGASAATKTWDGGAGTGAWGTGNNWNSNGVPANADSLVFNAALAAGQYSISLGSNRTAAGIAFSSASGTNAFTFTGNTLTLTSAGIVNNDADTQTFSSTVALTTASQTFNAASGALTFNAVTLGSNLTLSGASNVTIGSGGGSLLVSGGNRTLTLNTGGTRTIGKVSLSNNNTARTLTVTGAGSASITGVISNGGTGAGQLTKSGNGTLTLSGANTYSGTTTLSAGTINANNQAALGTGAVSLSGGTLNSDTGATLGNTLTAAADSTLSNITLTGALTQTGSRTLTLSNATLNGSIYLSNTAGTGRTLTANVASGTSNIGGTIANFNGSGTAGSLIKSGAGSLVLSGANTYSGGTTISAGTLIAASNSALGNAGWSNTIVNGATLGLQGNIALNQSGLSLSGSGSAGTGALLNLSGNNAVSAQLTFTGNTTIGATAGTLTLSNQLGLANYALTIAGAGNTSVSGPVYNAASLTNAASGNVAFSGTVNVTNALTQSGTGTLTLSGATSNYLGSLVIHSGTVVAAKTGGAFAASAPTVTVGDSVGAADSALLRLDGNQQLATSTAVTVNSDGKLTLNNVSQSVDQVAGTGTIDLASTGALSVGNGANSTFAGTIIGAGTLTKTNGGSTLTLTGANTYTGTTTISAGTLQVGAGGTTGTLGTGAVVNNAALVFNRSSAATVANTISGSGSLTLAGTGAITLTGTANSYTGATTINSGSTLQLGDGATSGNLTGTSGIANSGTLAFNQNSAVTFDRTVSGTGSVTNASAGTLTINSANSYTGGTVNSGSLKLGQVAALGAAGQALTLSGGTLDLATNASVNAYNTTVSGHATILSDKATAASAGITHTLGTLSINGSTLGVAAGANVAGNSTYGLTFGATALMGNATLDVANNGTGAGTLTLGTVTGAGRSLTKTGSGTLALSDTNTFSGGLFVTAGTVSGSGTTGAGGFKAFGDYAAVAVPTTVISVANGATLQVDSTDLSGYGDPNTNILLNLSLNGSGVNGGGALRATGGTNTWTGNISLAGNTTITNTAAAGYTNALYLGAMVFNGSSYTVPTAVDLNDQTLTINGTGTVNVTGTMGGTGDTGSVIVDGASVAYLGRESTYTGTTTVNSGVLLLATETGNVANGAIRGNLTIGDGLGAANSATVHSVGNYFLTGVTGNEHISDSVTVTINADGLLSLTDPGLSGGAKETLGHIVMNGGRIDTHNGAGLWLGGVASGNDIDVLTGNAVIDGAEFHVGNNVGGYNRSLNVSSGATLTVNTHIFGKDWTKVGAGTMIVTADNASNGYTGTTTVAEGILRITNSGALGAAGSGVYSTTVEHGATLQLTNTGANVTVGAEEVHIAGTGLGGAGALNSTNGDNAWAGAIKLDADATIKTDADLFTITGGVTGSGTNPNSPQTLTLAGSGNTTLRGPITDGTGGGRLGIAKTGSGTATLGGVDTFTGAINITAGTLRVDSNNTLGYHQNAVAVAAGATFSLTSIGGGAVSNTIGSVTGQGNVDIASQATLVVSNTVADTFDGTLSNTGLFVKQGAGTFTFSSTSNTSAFDFDGTVRLDAGTMEFQGGSGTGLVSTDALSIGTLQLNGGTLYLNASYINVGTLNITANTILDFGTGGASVLNATNIYIAAGVVLTINNWSSETDFLFANNTNYAASGGFRLNDSSGTLADFNQIGTQPENQIHFTGTNSEDGSHTTWINSGFGGYTNWEIRPIPEPSTYGAILLAGCLGLFGWSRYRRSARK